MKTLKIVLSILFGSMIHSCQSIVQDVDLPEIEIKSVVQMRYDKALNKYDGSITKSNPIFGKPRNEFEVIEDALVTVEGGGLIDTVSYDPNSEYYTGESGITYSVGEQYNLNVTLANGEILTSSALYPNAPLNISMTIDSTTDGFETKYNIKISWDDIPGIQEYYQVEYYSIYDFDGVKDTFGSYGQVEVGDNEKSRLTNRFETYRYSEPGSNWSYQTFVVVSGITKDQYEYSKFLYNYEPENPFAEPVTVPSNVTGGLGMFVLKNSVITQLK